MSNSTQNILPVPVHWKYNIYIYIDENDIAELFSNKYCDLIKTVCLLSLWSDKNVSHCKWNWCKAYWEKCVYDIEVNDVKTEINNLKLGKTVGEERLNSDHIIDGPALPQNA